MTDHQIARAIALYLVAKSEHDRIESTHDSFDGFFALDFSIRRNIRKETESLEKYILEAGIAPPTK